MTAIPAPVRPTTPDYEPEHLPDQAHDWDTSTYIDISGVHGGYKCRACGDVRCMRCHETDPLDCRRVAARERNNELRRTYLAAFKKWQAQMEYYQEHVQPNLPRAPRGWGN
ncbi:Uncharacterised protein [Mycobacteroides abscessus subsp. massiliense]|nr:Uncharacterised protein [Mycobacteroides abscessus subsp. massiliense]